MYIRLGKVNRYVKFVFIDNSDTNDDFEQRQYIISCLHNIGYYLNYIYTHRRNFFNKCY